MQTVASHPTEGVSDMAEDVRGQPTDHRRARHRGVVHRRRAVRPQAVPRSTATRARRRRSTVPHRAFGAVGLVAALLLAIMPVHASGLAPVAAEQIAPETHAVANDTDRDIADAPTSVSRDRTASRDPAPTSHPGQTEDARAAVGAPPVIGWYRLAATEQGVSADLLRALHDVESSGAGDGCVTNAEGSGAVGPFQFKRATFRQYGVDANHDGDDDICSFADALFSAARYLRALGVGDLDDPRTRQALARYGTDPDRVLVLARSYQDRAVLTD
jgi:hypothetical protein